MDYVGLDSYQEADRCVNRIRKLPEVDVPVRYVLDACLLLNRVNCNLDCGDSFITVYLMYLLLFEFGQRYPFLHMKLLLEVCSNNPLEFSNNYFSNRIKFNSLLTP